MSPGHGLKSFFQEFGGVLRKVLATDAQIMDHRKQRLSAIADKNLVKTFFESGVLAESKYAKPLSQLFLIVPFETDPEQYRVDFAGAGSANVLGSRFEKDLARLLQPKKQMQGLFTGIFESFVHKTLSSGGDSTFDPLVTQLQSLWPPFRNRTRERSMDSYLSCSKRL